MSGKQHCCWSLLKGCREIRVLGGEPGGWVSFPSPSQLSGCAALIPAPLFAGRSGAEGERADLRGGIRAALRRRPLRQQAVENHQ